MQLIYEGKKQKDEILNSNYNYSFSARWTKKNNLLVEGDNLLALKVLLKEYGLKEKIDLIYIDPPFATGNVFTINEDRATTISRARIGKIAYTDTQKGDAFLAFLQKSLVLSYELLSPSGSIYLHINDKMSCYVRVFMDEIFGIENFRNDIARIKCNPKNFFRSSYGNIKDSVLFYTKSKNNIWHDIRKPMSKKELDSLYKKKDKDGRAYTTVPLHAPGECKSGETQKPFRHIMPPRGRHWRCAPEKMEKLEKEGMIEWSSNGVPRKIIYADEVRGKKVQDVWEYKDGQNILYPTEKNLKMLEYIVANSSNKDSLVLDFFCGSGSFLLASSNLGRQWIGVDSSKEAINITKKRLQNREKGHLSSYSLDFCKVEKL